jgi:hippurate hydrolase
VVTVGAFHAGTMYNVIPETATFQATVRSFSQEAHEQLAAEMTTVCEGIASAYGLGVEATYEQLYPVTVNHASGVELAKAVVGDNFGADHWIDLPNPLPGSEDFSRVLDEVPGAMIFLGATPEGGDPFTRPFNHSNEAEFDDTVLSTGVTLYADFATRVLSAS